MTPAARSALGGAVAVGAVAVARWRAARRQYPDVSRWSYEDHRREAEEWLETGAELHLGNGLRRLVLVGPRWERHADGALALAQTHAALAAAIRLDDLASMVDHEVSPAPDFVMYRDGEDR